MWLKLGLCVIFLYCCIDFGSPQDTCDASGCKDPRDGTYFMTAPQKIHPNMLVNVLMAVIKNYYHEITVRVAIKREGEEVIADKRIFQGEGYAVMQLHVPDSAKIGNYTLRMEGYQSSGLANTEGVAGFVFENETDLMFSTKQLSLFIETNKPLYRQGQLVKFRVMPVKRNLMSWSGSLESVYMRDPTGTIVRRFDMQQTNAGGVLDLEFQLSEQPTYGTWTIEIDAFGHIYQQTYEVHEFFITAIDVNVSMPLYHSVDEYGVGGIIMANLSLGQPVKGYMSVHAEIRLPPGEREEGKNYQWPKIERENVYFPGMSSFLFTMSELTEAVKKGFGSSHTLARKEVYVEAFVEDWFRKYDATGWMTTVIYGNEVELTLLGDKARTFKPNREMAVYFAVAHPDGTPLRYYRRQVTVNLSVKNLRGTTRNEERKLITPDDGMVKYTWMPQDDDEHATISAYYDVINTRAVQLTAYRYYSPTESFIYVTSSTESAQVDHYMVFTVSTNTHVKNVYYLIAAGGNIVTGGILQMKAQQKTFSVSLSRDMMPEAHIVVWHVYKGEVITDSLNFFVNGTRLNKVDLFFNTGKDFTKDTVEITGITDRSAYIGSRVLDYALYKLGWSNFITETSIVEELRTFDSHVNHSFTYTWKTADNQDELVHFPAPTYGVDANTTFSYAGLIVFTDTNVTRLPQYCNWTLGYYPCMDRLTCYHIDQWCDGARQCSVDGQDEMGCPVTETSIYTPERQRVGLLTRHYVEDGLWCWGGHFVMPNGRIDFAVSLPDEPISWSLGGFSVSQDWGFGIVYDIHMLESTRPFYMRAEAPATEVIKGEMLGIRIALFNYWQENLEAVVILHDSEDYRFVVVEEFGIVSSYAPRTIRGTVQTMVYLEKGHVYDLQLPVLPIRAGCMEVTISANSLLYRDTETLEICVKFDGVTNHLHTPYFIDLINSGTLTLHDLEIPVPERFVKPEERKHLYVPGSPNATVGIVGDVVGPGFFYEYLNAENTIRKPYGGGEQNMFNFAYNLYNLKYQKRTDQLDTDVLKISLSHLNSALQRQMGYMNKDGSFSMFRDYQEHTPSTWLSAFVLRTLFHAKEGDWEKEYFFIPTELLNQVASWLCTRQESSGAFREDAPIYDRKQRPNTITREDGSVVKENIALTAYVLISLMETKGLTGHAETCKEAAKSRALQYLEPLVGRITGEYEMTITTYALDVAGSTKANTAYERMISMKQTEGNQVYWADKPIPANDVIMVDTLPYYQPRKYYPNEGYAVEATSYALMVCLRRDERALGNSIMKWLQSMRNSFFGQASTQDTITALIALYEFAKMDTNRALYNVWFQVEATSMENRNFTIHLERENWVNMQTVEIDPVWGSVRGQVFGTGLVLMQLDTEVNVEYAEQILPIAQEHFFDVYINNEYKGHNFSVMNQHACVKWARPDISETSGLAVLEVNIPTGYVITNDVLRLYAQSGTVPTLRRAEQYGRKTVFYFDYLSENWTCVDWRTDRWYPVANMTIQHLLKVYDYYEPGMHNTTLYTTFDLHGLHICQVCGSFQCPYCPHYNNANTITISLSFGLFFALLGLLLSRRVVAAIET